jgi:N-acetylmuramate 1-kinase
LSAILSGPEGRVLSPPVVNPELPTDTRFQQLTAFAAGVIRDQVSPLQFARASADASFRRYFRISQGDKTWIAVDAPPARENVPAFIKVAGLFATAGVHVPTILATDLERGFLLVSDLGPTTYLHAFQAGHSPDLFADAIAALLKIQLASQPGVLPPYDDALLRREIELFPEWYVGRHLQRSFTSVQADAWSAISRLILDRALATPTVFVHRDFMPRNLMVSEPNPGVLDFQDAVHGPITYDIGALLRDAFLSWDEAVVIDVTARYWEQARKAGLPVGDDFGEFYEGVEWMVLQRHLKILGIFARIYYRDGKSHYLPDTPRFLSYVRKTSGRYRKLTPLLRLLDELQDATPAVGLTF